MKNLLIALFLAGVAIIIWQFASTPNTSNNHAGHHIEHEDDEFESGAHGGRLLKKGDFALEITIFESGSPPRFQIYAYQNGQMLNPDKVMLSIELSRLGDITDKFKFSPEANYLTSSTIVREPHSFDVTVNAGFEDQTFEWTYQSHEGRTQISDAAAAEAGVVIEKVGPATIVETIDVLGQVKFAPGAKAVLRGRFPGQIIDVFKTVGDPVTKGEVIVRIDNNTSLRSYDITSPIDGVLIERHTNVGDVVGEAPLMVVGDVTQLIVDYHVFASDLQRVLPGQDVMISSLEQTSRTNSTISTLLPTKETATQTIIARVPLANPNSTWLPGMTVRGDIVVDKIDVPRAVRSEALQSFRDFTVVFEKVGDTYEVRMLELGRQTAQWTEILDGIEIGANYVSQNSYLIKADIEKSGASHDH